MLEPWILFILAAMSCAFGFAWLALSMNVHWQHVMRSTPSTKTRITLRVLGAVALLATGILCFIADRPSMAILVWLMLSAASAPSISMLLAWRPDLLRYVCPIKS